MSDEPTSPNTPDDESARPLPQPKPKPNPKRGAFPTPASEIEQATPYVPETDTEHDEPDQDDPDTRR
jgi:hypothetical protein